ncbi:MAG: hypothetical protein ACI8RD_005840 [Bacillariaceae sp.]|jgi:hypothetical protein
MTTISTSTTTTVAAAWFAKAKAMAMECHHGSTAKKFALGSDYYNATLKFIARGRSDDTKYLTMDLAKLGHDHPQLVEDPEFCKYLFATCTEMYLSDSFAVDEVKHYIFYYKNNKLNKSNIMLR